MANSDKSEFGELVSDEAFVITVKNLDYHINKIKKSVSIALAYKNSKDISTQEKVKIDIYLAYCINSLYFINCKLHGVNMKDHEVKNELARVRNAILRDKKIKERTTLRPLVNKHVAGRFVRHGLHITFDAKEKKKEG